MKHERFREDQISGALEQPIQQHRCRQNPICI